MRAFVDKLRDDNERLYSNEETLAPIRAVISRSFPLPWIYLFELTQNALDAKATSVRITTGPDSLVFEHDGTMPFDQGAVRALSKVGMSTKRLDSVGFMGVGFKSVFHRFRRVEVADAGVRILFHLRHDEGVMGEQHPRWLDTVLPHWNEDGEGPSSGTTTRFTFSQRVGEESPASDVRHLVDPESPRTLGIFGLRGLLAMETDGTRWSIAFEGDEVHVDTAERRHAWVYVRRPYRPSRQALARLLEARDVKLTEAEADRELRTDRAVVGFIPLVPDGRPLVPGFGSVYATLPTGESISVRCLLQADWLLDVTRRGIVGVRGNAWQQEIVDQIPGVIADLIGVFARRTESRGVATHSALSMLVMNPTGQELGEIFSSQPFRDRLAEALRPLAFLPVHAEGGARLAAAHELVQPPWPVLEPFAGAPELRADILFGGPVLDARALSRDVVRALVELNLLHPMTSQDLAAIWPTNVERWWRAIAGPPEGASESARPAMTALVRMLHGLREFAKESGDASWLRLPCLPTDAGTFRPMKDLRRYGGEMPSASDPDGALILERLGPFLLKSEDRLLRELASLLQAPRSTLHREHPEAAQAVLAWYQDAVTETVLDKAIASATDVLAAEGKCDPPLAIAVASWAERNNRPSAVSWLAVSTPEGDRVVGRAEAFVADPYVEDGDVRRALFASRFPVSPAYLSGEAGGAARWRVFLEDQLGLQGRLRIEETVVNFPPAEAKAVAEAAGLAVTGLPHANRSGYTVVDRTFSLPIGEAEAPHLARWLEGGHTALVDAGVRIVRSEFNRSKDVVRGTRPCSWVAPLTQLAWVPTRTGALARPADVVLDADEDDAVAAALSPSLAQTLRASGIVFGTNVPRADVVRRLRARAHRLSPAELASLLHEVRQELADGKVPLKEVRSSVADLVLPLKSGGRVRADRVVKAHGAHARSRLGDHVVAVSELDEAVASALAALGASVFDPPVTTSGAQALSFLRTVWKRARDREPLGADEMRRILPLAYGYVLDDASSDPALAGEWETARTAAWVYARPSWKEVRGPDALAVNDLMDPRLEAYVAAGTIHVSAAHLGDTPEAIARTARALGVPLLSELVNPRWSEGTRIYPPWLSSLERLCTLLSELERRTPMAVMAFDKIVLHVGKTTLPVGAYDEKGTLRVGGKPSAFMTEAAEVLVGHYQLTQRGGAIPSLIGAIAALDKAAFEQRLRRLGMQLGIDPGAGPESRRVSTIPPAKAEETGTTPEAGAAEESSEAIAARFRELILRQGGVGVEPGEDDSSAQARKERRGEKREGEEEEEGKEEKEASEDDGTPKAPHPPLDPDAIRAVDVHTGSAAPPRRRKSSSLEPNPKRKDWEKTEAAKRKAGERGEEAVMISERKRLAALGIDPERLVWTSHTVNEEAPFDILSVGDDGEPLHIEVKATSGDDEGSDFEISAEELAFGLSKGNGYAIYRVVDVFTAAPRIYRHRNVARLVAEGRAHVELATARMRLPKGEGGG